MKFVDVQKQSGTYDCGLFAVAFATCLAIGVHPGSFTFKQIRDAEAPLQVFREWEDPDVSSSEDKKRMFII